MLKKNFYGDIEDVLRNVISDDMECPEGKKKCKIDYNYIWKNYFCVEDNLDCPTFDWIYINQQKDQNNLSKDFQIDDKYFMHIRPESLEEDNGSIKYYVVDPMKDVIDIKLYHSTYRDDYGSLKDSFNYNPYVFNFSYNLHAYGECIDMKKNFLAIMKDKHLIYIL